MMITKIQDIKVFKEFKDIFTLNLENFIDGVEDLFYVDIDKDAIWNTYLESFPEENGIRQSFNCNSCKQFIRKYGRLVKINKQNQLVSFWRFDTEDQLYQVAMDNLANLVEKKGNKIKDIFIRDEKIAGLPSNIVLNRETGITTEWYHFSYEFPSRFKEFKERNSMTLAGKLSEVRGTYTAFYNGLTRVKIDSIELCLELINQNSIENGAQFKANLKKFLDLKKKFTKVNVDKRSYFIWRILNETSVSVAKLYSSSIGTLLKDFDNNIPIDEAVIKFGKVMNPYNYKRPKNLIVTPKMYQEAEKTIIELGLENSLSRRLAVTTDISINNLIWTNRATQTLETSTGIEIFNLLKKEAETINPRKFNKLQEIDYKDFLQNVLPNVSKVELLLENKHENNLVSLISPTNLDAPPLTNWDNGLTWTYNGGIADSIKEKVKSKGGNVNALVRCSIAWNVYDDYDLHLYSKDLHVYHGNSSSKGWKLDVDMNVEAPHSRITAVENICYDKSLDDLKNKIFDLKIQNYTFRENIGHWFKAEVEFNNEVYSFVYDKTIPHKRFIQICQFTFNNNGQIVFNERESLPINSDTMSKEIWGMRTNQFQEVTCVLNSPNYWDKPVGNQHLLFMLKGAKNEDTLIRGFFNEQLPPNLLKHKRAFEVLGSRLQVEPATSENQLSGLGFNLTKSNNFIAKVTGVSTRILKVKI